MLLRISLQLQSTTLLPSGLTLAFTKDGHALTLSEGAAANIEEVEDDPLVGLSEPSRKIILSLKEQDRPMAIAAFREIEKTAPAPAPAPAPARKADPTLLDILRADAAQPAPVRKGPEYTETTEMAPKGNTDAMARLEAALQITTPAAEPLVIFDQFVTKPDGNMPSREDIIAYVDGWATRHDMRAAILRKLVSVPLPHLKRHKAAMPKEMRTAIGLAINQAMGNPPPTGVRGNVSDSVAAFINDETATSQLMDQLRGEYGGVISPQIKEGAEFVVTTPEVDWSGYEQIARMTPEQFTQLSGTVPPKK